VAHTRRYVDSDPLLAKVRRIALALPEATEVEAWGRPTFRAGKIFAVFSGDDSHESALVLKTDPDEREALTHDTRFYSPPYWGAAGWLALDLLVAPVDWDEVGELLESAYRQVALRRMVAALDAQRS
jgi:hypothetical protein